MKSPDHNHPHHAHVHREQAAKRAQIHDHGIGIAPGPTQHDKLTGHSVAMYRNRFWLTLLLSLST